MRTRDNKQNKLDYKTWKGSVVLLSLGERYTLDSKGTKQNKERLGKAANTWRVIHADQYSELSRNTEPSGQSNAGQTNRTLYYSTVLITWTRTCSGQCLMAT